MTEEINHSYDGGLYANLIQNRTFLDDAKSPAHWSVVKDEGSAASIALDSANPVNDKLPSSLRLTVAQATKDHPAGRRGVHGLLPSPEAGPQAARPRLPCWFKPTF